MTTPRRLLPLAAALLSLAGSAFALPAPPSDDAKTHTHASAPDAALTNDAATFHRHTTTLANPFFEGRAPGTKGNLLAADYIEFHFKKLGLVPAFPINNAPAPAAMMAVPAEQLGAPNKSYRQPFAFGTTVSMKDSAFTITAPNAAPTTLQPDTDYTVLGFSGDAQASGPLVFVGYGLNIAKDGYSSYPSGTDLKGKIALVMRFEPMNEHGKSQWDDAGWSYNAALEPKITQAVNRGAVGVILVSPPGADDPRTTKLETLDSTKPAGKPLGVPVVMLSIPQADALVKAADPQHRSLMDLRKLADDLPAVTEKGSVIDLPGATVSLKATVTREPVLTSNLGGILPGVGELADQYVVIGAHYDHVGYGLFGSRGGPDARGKVHPGADDNASGTSGMLILAEKLTAQYAAMPPDQPRRSILFMGFTAEESGLIGSRHYTQNMIVPKDKHAIMLNLDMIGRYRGDDEKGMPMELGGVATAKGLQQFIQPMLDSSGLKLAPKPGGSGPSDHASFNGVQIPVLFFFTGLHDEYHSPADLAETLNPQGAARVIALVDRIAAACATRPEPFVYDRDSQSQPSAATGDQQAAAPPRSRVRFGIAPGDYSGADGVLVGEVTEGGSAALAGILKGDRMIKWNGEPLTTVESWMPLLTKQSPGDKVEIVVIRDGKEVPLTATLQARRQGNQ